MVNRWGILVAQHKRQEVSKMNRANIAVAPSATVAGIEPELDAHRKAFRVQEDFPLDATTKMVSGTNPWRPRGLGWVFYETVLRHYPISTVGEILKIGMANGIDRFLAMQHLRWLFTWGGSYIEIGGRLYAPPPEGTEVTVRTRKRGRQSEKI